MKNKEDGPEKAAPSANSGQGLRRRAEEIAREKAAQAPEDLETPSPEETRQTLHELRVHQIELEMQNEELRRAQVELDAGRARYFDLYDLAPVGYCTISEQGLILETNLTASILLGVARGALVKQILTRFILKEDRDIYYRHRKQLFETGEPQAYELRMVKKDGMEFWAHLAATAAQDAGGAPVCRVVLSDITERKRTEQQIISLARFPAENPDPVLRLRPDGVILYANEASQAILQEWDCAVGDAAPPVWRNAVGDAFAERSGKHIDVESVGRVWSFLMTPIIEAGYINLYGSDITERKLAEEALQHQQNFARTLMENMVAGVVACDAEGKLTVFNRLARVWHGLDATNRPQKEWASYYHLFLEDGQTPMTMETMPLARAYRGETLRDAGMVICAKGQPPRQIISNCAPVRDAQGHLAGAVGIMHDITELKRAEEEIQTLNAELEQRIAQRTAQLANANQELEAFAYSVSHDLRAPLRGIDGWSLALLEDCRGQLDERGCGYLDRVRAEAQRMGHLIDDMLLLSRVTRIEMQPVTVNLSALVQTITARLQAAQPERQFEFIIQPGLAARGDPHLLEIALTNLLDNAAKFTGTRPLARVEFGKTTTDGKTAFFVSDNGVGFDVAYASKLFGAFHRMHRQSEFPGTGIGLATVQRIVHRHGGRVWADAQVDQGATFYFTLEASA